MNRRATPQERCKVDMSESYIRRSSSTDRCGRRWTVETVSMLFGEFLMPTIRHAESADQYRRKSSSRIASAIEALTVASSRASRLFHVEHYLVKCAATATRCFIVMVASGHNVRRVVRPLMCDCVLGLAVALAARVQCAPSATFLPYRLAWWSSIEPCSDGRCASGDSTASR